MEGDGRYTLYIIEDGVGSFFELRELGSFLELKELKELRELKTYVLTTNKSESSIVLNYINSFNSK